ncbi:MAG: cation:proton antiporter [Acidimicrobiia bacterium]|nr:cation:proton antiporter [Acidimicrobiia bacterium]
MGIGMAILAIAPPGEHEVLVFLVQLSILLGLARFAGSLARRIGQPAVVGELAAGIAAGPSLFGRVAPQAFEWVFAPGEDASMIFALAWLGLLLLLAVTGIESDLDVVRQLGRPAAVVTTGSLIVPLAGGLLLGFAMPNELVGPTTSTGLFAVFLAVALSISSLPVVARVLSELGMVRRDVGQLILAVAVANDVIGWLLLGLVVGVAGSGGAPTPGAVAITIVAVAAFFAAALTLGSAATEWGLRQTAGRGIEAQVGLMVGTVALAGAVTQAIGVEAVLGAFVAGLVIGRSRWRDERAISVLETVTNALLAPLFFATAGLRVDVAVFAEPTVAVWSLIIIAVATATKLLGAGVGARLAGLPGPEARALGVGLNARGALEIVIASIGLSLGILTDASYAAIVIMALTTSIVAPPLLRRALRDWPGTESEQRRLSAEEAARRQVILSDRPPLLLTRGRPGSISAAQFIHCCWPPHQPVVVATSVDRSRLAPILNTFADRSVKVLEHEGDLARLVSETRRGYGAIVLGVNETVDEPVLGTLHREVLATTDTPVVIVRRERISGRPLPAPFAHALVPITAQHTSRAALELACGLAVALGARLTLAHIVTEPNLDPFRSPGGLTTTGPIADPTLRTAADTARVLGAREVATIARTAANAATELAGLALELDVDIIVAGTTVQGDRFGPTATFLLDHAPMSVAVVATPAGWTRPPTSRRH